MTDQPAPENSEGESLLAGGPPSVLEVGRVALKLGLTSFGGPIAHLGYFRDEYVVKRRWLDEQTYADLVALSQFLPGPASSQVGIGIGTMRAGLRGGLAAWLGFTLPSAVALTVFALSVDRFDVASAGWVHGLKVVAVAVVAQAVWGMGRQFCTDRARATIAILAALAILAVPSAFAQGLVIVGAGLVGWRLYRDAPLPPPANHHEVRISRRIGIACWGIFFGLLLGLPLLRLGSSDGAVDLFERFFRVGSLVFGGGHVVLPLLQTQVVPTGWMTNDQFLAGYGAAQAVPGPLFTFAAYLGAIRARNQMALRERRWRWERSSCRRFCLSGGRFHSGMRCARNRSSAARSTASTRRWLASCWRRSIPRSGPAPSYVPPTSVSPLPASVCL